MSKKSKIIVKPVCLDKESIRILTTLGGGNLSKGCRDAATMIENLNSLSLVNKIRPKS